MILLDTNVISELVKPAPAPAVLAFAAGLAPSAVCTAALCEAEIWFGVARLAPGHRRDALAERLRAFLDIGFANRILPFDRACAGAYADIRRAREAAGRPIPTMDAMIAATARAYAVDALATRNIKDFDGCDLTLIDPWQ